MRFGICVPTSEFLEELWRIDYAHRVSVEDLDRRFMNLEREAPLVLSHPKATWERLFMRYAPESGEDG